MDICFAFGEIYGIMQFWNQVSHQVKKAIRCFHEILFSSEGGYQKHWSGFRGRVWNKDVMVPEGVGDLTFQIVSNPPSPRGPSQV